MNRFSRRGFLTTSIAAAAAPVLSGSSAKPLERAARIPSSETPYWLEATGTPGVAVALLENRKVREVLTFGSTDAAGKLPVTEATVFQAASLSKQALLYAALAVVDSGKLDLDRPLISYRKTPFDAPEADLPHITARHVLTHTTGWPNWPRDGEPPKQIRPLGQWGYSGAAFVYLQEAIESILEEPTEAYTRRLVFEPLGMRTSSFVWRDSYASVATPGYEERGVPLALAKPAKPNGAASLLTTPRDYGLLLEAYLGPELRRRHPDVFHRQVGIDRRIGWALGWGTADDALWQWGHNTGFKAFAALVPEKGLGIVALTNGAGGQRITREWVNAWLGVNLPPFFLPNVDL